MFMRKARKVTAAMLLAACSTAMGVENAGQLPKAADELMRIYPGAQVERTQGKVHILYGVPMTAGLNARAAADSFIQLHGEAFGCGPLEVQEKWSVPFIDGSKTVFTYQQFIGGIPVEFGLLKVLVLNNPVPTVVYAAGTMAAPPAEVAPARAAISGETAVALVRNMPVWQGVPNWSKATKVYFQGNGDWVAPVLTWKFEGFSSNPDDKLRKTFFVDAVTGAIIFIRDEIYNTDVSGSIKGMGSPGVYPDAAYNPPALINIPDMRATITGGGNAYTDAGGLFTIANPGTAPVSVTCGVSGVGAGRWLNIFPNVAAITGAANNITPPGPADIVMNQVPSEFNTAQVNAFVCTSVTHDYFKARAPGFAGLDLQIRCNTGVAGTCNAFFDTTPSINFYNAGGGCVNTAYTTVISHEYGHFIVNRLGLAQNAFGEGYGDTNAEMIWDDNVTGRGFNGTQGSFVRDPIAANVQYPCSNEIHFCGQVVSGVWWRIRTNMGAFYGNPAGLDQTRQLEVNWSLITTGGPDGSNSAGPSTAIEVLTADDNDGNIGNGTPNYSRICPGFAAHSIQCPALTLLTFQYPNGRPATVTPNQQFVFPVNIVGVSASPQPGTGLLNYRLGASGAFTSVAMVEGAPNQYTATLPAAPCGQDIQYYVSARTTTNLLETDPQNAPTAFFTAAATQGTTTTPIVTLDFNTDPGWSVTNDPSLTTGAWERVTPLAGAGTGTPPSGFGGSGMCWVTDNRPDAGGANFDVDGGPTTVLSSVYDLSGYPRVTVSYQRWLYSTGNDPMSFWYSANGGTTWTLLESTPGTAVAGPWTARSFGIFNPTSTMRFRWQITDNPNDSVTEGGIDQFQIVGLVCAGQVCYANCDGSTGTPVLTVSDFSCFLNRFAAGDSYANCDGSTTIPVLNVADFACFLNAFSAGCS